MNSLGTDNMTACIVSLKQGSGSEKKTKFTGPPQLKFELAKSVDLNDVEVYTLLDTDLVSEDTVPDLSSIVPTASYSKSDPVFLACVQQIRKSKGEQSLLVIMTHKSGEKKREGVTGPSIEYVCLPGVAQKITHSKARHEILVY